LDVSPGEQTGMGTALEIVSTVNDMMENFGCVCFACQSVGKPVEIFKKVLVYRGTRFDFGGL
jgi:hypothetical protein